MTGIQVMDPTLYSGVWEGLSFPRSCESDETRWTETCLVFSEARINNSNGNSIRGMDPGTWWTREEPTGAIFQFVGKGTSHWRARQIPFTLRGVVEQGAVGGSTNGSLKITIIKRHVGSFSNMVQYEGSMSRDGSMIQGTFADGTFRLRRIDPVAHVLARELSGAWNGESTCRRDGQSSTTWKGVQLVFTPLPPGDGRGWGMLVTGGGNSLWNEQRIPFCVTGRLSLPGLEVELEKQHVEGYHNRIAYFGRVLAGGGAGGGASGGNGSDRCGGGSGVGMTTASLEDTANSVRLVGVYEHGDFILLRNPVCDFNAEGMGGMGPGDRHGEMPSVLQACIELFRRCSEPGSVWSISGGSRRTALVPPTARSYSGGVTASRAPLPMLPAQPSQPLPPPPSQMHAARVHAQPQAGPPMKAPLSGNHLKEDGPWKSIRDASSARNSGSRIASAAQRWETKDAWGPWLTQHGEETGEQVGAAPSVTVATKVRDIATAESAAWRPTWTNTDVGLVMGMGRNGATDVHECSTDAAGSNNKTVGPGARARVGSSGGPGGSPALVPGSGGGGRTDADALPPSAPLDKTEGSPDLGASIGAARIMGWTGLYDGIGDSKLDAATGDMRGVIVNGTSDTRTVKASGNVGDVACDEKSWMGTLLARPQPINGDTSHRGNISYAMLAQQGSSLGHCAVDEKDALRGDCDGSGLRSNGDVDRVLSGDAGLDFGFGYGLVLASSRGGGAGGRWDVDQCGVRLRTVPDQDNSLRSQSRLLLEPSSVDLSDKSSPSKSSTAVPGIVFEEPHGLSAIAKAKAKARGVRNIHGSDDDYSTANNSDSSGDSRLELYRKTLAGLVLGEEGDSGVDNGTGSNGGCDKSEKASNGDRGALEDLRVLRACLSDPSLSDNHHLEVLRSVARSKTASSKEIDIPNGNNCVGMVLSSKQERCRADNGGENGSRGDGGGENGGGGSGALSDLYERSGPAASSARVSRPKETDSCKICFSGIVDALLMPCGHLCVCVACGLKLYTCPVCHVDVCRVQSVYRT